VRSRGDSDRACCPRWQRRSCWCISRPEPWAWRRRQRARLRPEAFGGRGRACC
jgi:hypothetical protein